VEKVFFDDVSIVFSVHLLTLKSFSGDRSPGSKLMKEMPCSLNLLAIRK
jgi:hypothetical protein